MTWVAKKQEWASFARSVHHSCTLHTKDHWIWKMHWRGKEFTEQTASVFGPHIFIPAAWTNIEKEVIHEATHVKQMGWLGFGKPWIGLIPFSILSVFCLPVLFTCRFWFEMHAEAAALAFKYKTGSNSIYVRHEFMNFAETLAGPVYLWAWPKGSAVRIAVKWAQKIVDGQG